MDALRIHKRGLTSFFTLFGFLIMSITGLVLYVMPAGRVAYWITWDFFGMSKTDWDNIHILSSILFIVAGAFHTFFNWKPLMNYFKERMKTGIRLRLELLIASVLSVWVIVGAIWPHPPLSYLLNLNAWVKTTWIAHDDYEPPFGHAELLSLKTFATKMDIDLSQAEQELTANGIIFAGADETLEAIGKKNGISPMNLYLLIKKFEPAPQPEKLKSYTPESIEVEFAGSGIGAKSIAAVCERLGLDKSIAISRLKTAGLSTDLEQTMRSVAQASKTDPIEIMKVLLIAGYVPKIDQ